MLKRIHDWGNRNPKLYYVAPPSVWAIWIYLSGMAHPDRFGAFSFVSFDGADKAVHFASYFIFSLLIVRGWQRNKMPPLGLHGFVWLLCFVFGFG